MLYEVITSVIGYELPNYRYISEDSVREQTTSLIYNDLYFNIHASRIDSLVLEENKIECKLLIKQKEHTVIFRLKNEKLYVSTEPKSETRKLGLAEAICLTKIAKSATPDVITSYSIHYTKLYEYDLLIKMSRN